MKAALEAPAILLALFANQFWFALEVVFAVVAAVAVFVIVALRLFILDLVYSLQRAFKWNKIKKKVNNNNNNSRSKK
jgi:hypothetical protein